MKWQDFEEYISTGLVSKSEKNDLVVYNCTDKVKASNLWDSVTLKANGIIFNKKENKLIAMPFENITEFKDAKELDSFEVYDDLDGVMGLLYWQEGLPRIATKDSFDSPQANVANTILKEKGYYDNLLSCKKPGLKDLTLVFNIIYPSNKKVCTYLGSRDLFLIAVINNNTGEDYSLQRDDIKELIKVIGCPTPLFYKNAIIENIVRSKRYISKDKKGWIVKTKSGDRLRILGTKYLDEKARLSKESPKKLWSSMANGVVQIKDESNLKDAVKLENEYRSVKTHILWEIDNMLRSIGLGDINNTDYLKKVAKYIKTEKLEYVSCFMPYLKRKDDVIEAYIMNKIKPDVEND